MTRRLMVNSLKRSDPPESYINDAWAELDKAVKAIQSSKPVSTSCEALYNFVEDLCRYKMADKIYSKLRDIVDEHVRLAMENINEQHHKPDCKDLDFLRLVNECWHDTCRQMSLIRNIFLYLDRTHVLTKPATLSIRDMGLDRFRHYFRDQREIESGTVAKLLVLIQKERRGEDVPRALLKDLLQMLSELSLYSKIFEPRFIEDTQRLYTEEGNQKAQELEVPAYLKHVARRLDEEQERLNVYLDASTKPQLIKVVEEKLLAAHVKTILSKGLNQLLEGMRLTELTLLHNLFSRVPNGPTELCTHFYEYIKKSGKEIVMNLEKDKTMVSDLLVFKDKMDQVVSSCFQKQERFLNSLKEAFEYFINQRPNKPAELLAKFVDSTLKSGHKCSSENELENLLDQIMVLFRFIHGKDVFEAFYKKDLAKRLLVNKSASVDAEKSMLSKLKQECGAAFTSKLEGMFKDMELSNDIGIAFKNYLANTKTDLGVELIVHVLTMGYWPTYTPMDVIMPNDLLNSQKSFQRFYLQKYNGRKLQWQPNLGSCVLTGNFPRAKKELQVSMLQALVLLLFNDTDDLTFASIKERTKIEQVELVRTLQSLALGKTRVLIKEPKVKDINDDDKFSYAANFTHALMKIRINQVQLKETQEEQSNTHERVFQDRQCQIDAAIVRIMKTRKSLVHQALIQELFEQLKFPVKSQDIKKRIESLIERDYLVRDKSTPNQYNYVA